jgi:diguanylate cyclase (GGDEF)-like protein/PAS domain S-box-containing protein
MTTGHGGIEDLVMGLPLPTLVFRRQDSQLLVTAFNDAAVRVTRGAVTRLVGRAADDVYGHEPDLLDTLHRALERGTPVVRESAIRLATSGNPRHARTHAVPFGTDLVILHFEDLTPQLQAESLATSVVDSLVDGLIAIGPDGRVILANRRASELIGLSVDELYGPDWWQHAEVLEATADTAEIGHVVMAGGDAVRDVEIVLRRPDQNVVALSVNHQPLLVDGKAHGMVMVYRDITEERAQVLRFETAFEAAPIGMGLMSFAGQYLRLNAEACSLLQMAQDEIEGRHWQDCIHPDDRAEAEEVLRMLNDGAQESATVEQRFLRADGAVLDVVKTMSVVRGTRPQDDYVICHVLDVSERRRYESELERRALHDHLTGLPNRALFADRLQHALDRVPRSGCPVAVVFLDLDEFKRVNDSLGHGAGDRVLMETATRLEACMRTGDTICRFGGDEFVVLCEDLEDEASALVVGERLLAEISGTPYVVESETLHMRGSVGVALARQGEPTTPERLMAESDAAMYRAKRRGGGRSELAGDETVSAARRLALEGDLRTALRGGDGDGLWLAYQPIVDVATGAMAGLEALLRWERPGHGPVSPAEVIPVAEESGLIVDLGMWVMHRAISDIAAWNGNGAPYVAINLSARQFLDEGLVDALRACLDSHGVDPCRISVEITESVAMGDAERALATMRALKDVGVRIAIDDFGTGFSSLGYLKRFPADTVKIDREFISDVAVDSEDRAIVSAVLLMARALGLEVVAEGVETEQQRSALVSLGCRRAQGFLFARPAPLADAVGSLPG